MSVPGQKVDTPIAITARRMLASDSDAVLAILKESREASMWSKESLLEAASQGNSWMAEVGGRVAGFLLGRIAADEFEVLNFAIASAYRRRGIATQLLRDVLQYARNAGTRRAFLEVRASNRIAIALYEKLGFRVCGRRANYYRDPADDAVLMAMEIQESNS